MLAAENKRREAAGKKAIDFEAADQHRKDQVEQLRKDDKETEAANEVDRKIKDE